MSVTLTGTGGLATRLAKIFFGIESANAYLAGGDISAGGLKSVGISTDNVQAQYVSALQSLIDSLYTQRNSTRDALSSWKSYLKSLAESTLIEQVHADNPLPTKDVENALIELLYQLKGAGTIAAADNDVDASTTSASVTAATGNTGNHTVVVSVLRPDGRTNELLLAETLDLRCTADGQEGGTARQETWSLKGEAEQTDKLSWDWPKGSGANASLTTVDADGANTLGTLLYGGNFDTFTTGANQPDYWGNPLVGVYGTDIVSEASVTYRSSSKCLEFLGTGGGPLSSIAQSFDVTTPATNTSGTSAELKPNTIYHVNFYARKSAGLLAGVIQCRLLNGSDVQMTDDFGSNLAFTVAHGALSSADWTAVSGSFCTPKVLPTSGQKLNIRVSTALTNGESVYIDDLTMTEVGDPAYTGGIYVSVHAGSTNPIIGDRSLVTVANDRAGEIQEWAERLFDLRAKGMQLYSDTAGTETLLDSLIA